MMNARSTTERRSPDAAAAKQRPLLLVALMMALFFVAVPTTSEASPTAPLTYGCVCSTAASCDAMRHLVGDHIATSGTMRMIHLNGTVAENHFKIWGATIGHATDQLNELNSIIIVDEDTVHAVHEMAMEGKKVRFYLLDTGTNYSALPLFSAAAEATRSNNDGAIAQQHAAILSSSQFLGGISFDLALLGAPIGAVAAVESTTGSVALLMPGATRGNKELLDGFTTGVNRECPSCRVFSHYFIPTPYLRELEPNEEGTSRPATVGFNVWELVEATLFEMKETDVVVLVSHNATLVKGFEQALHQAAELANLKKPMVLCLMCQHDELLKVTFPGFKPDEPKGSPVHGGLERGFIELEMAENEDACVAAFLCTFSQKAHKVLSDVLRLVVYSLEEAASQTTTTTTGGSNAALSPQDRLRFLLNKRAPTHNITAPAFLDEFEGTRFELPPPLGDPQLMTSNGRYLHSDLDHPAETSPFHSRDCMIVIVNSPSASRNGKQRRSNNRSLEIEESVAANQTFGAINSTNGRDDMPIVVIIDCHNMITLVPPTSIIGGPKNRTANTGQSFSAISSLEFVIFGGLAGDGEEATPTAEMVLISFDHAFGVPTLTCIEFDEGGATPEPRDQHAAAVSGMRLFIHGGNSESSKVLRDLWVADITTSSADSTINVTWKLLNNDDTLLAVKAHSMSFLSSGKVDGYFGTLVIAGGKVVNSPQKKVFTYNLATGVATQLEKLQSHPALPDSGPPCLIPFNNNTLLSFDANGAPTLLNVAFETWYDREEMTVTSHVEAVADGEKHKIPISIYSFHCMHTAGSSAQSIFVTPVKPNSGVKTTAIYHYGEAELGCGVYEGLTHNIAAMKTRSGCEVCESNEFSAFDQCLSCAVTNYTKFISKFSDHDLKLIHKSRYLHCEREDTKIFSTAVIGLLAASAFIAGLCVALLLWLIHQRVPNDQNVANAPKTAPLAITFISIADSYVHWRNAASDFHCVIDQFNGLLAASVAKHGGYNVKTVGEAVMIATKSTDQALSIVKHLCVSMKKTSWHSTLGKTLELKIGIDFCTPTIVNTEVAGYDYGGPNAVVAALLCKALCGNNIAITDAAVSAASPKFGIRNISHRQPDVRGYPFRLMSINDLLDFDPASPTMLGNSRTGAAGTGPSCSTSNTSLSQEDLTKVQVMEQELGSRSHAKQEKHQQNFIDNQAVTSGTVSTEEYNLLKNLTVDILRTTLTSLKQDQNVFTQQLQKRFAVAPDRLRPANNGGPRRGKSISLASLNMLAGRVLQTMDPVKFKASVRSAYEESVANDEKFGSGGPVGAAHEAHMTMPLTDGSGEVNNNSRSTIATGGIELHEHQPSSTSRSPATGVMMIPDPVVDDYSYDDVDAYVVAQGRLGGSVGGNGSGGGGGGGSDAMRVVVHPVLPVTTAPQQQEE